MSVKKEEKNNQIKEEEPKILLKSMSPYEKCQNWRIQEERHSKYTYKLFLEELVRLNSSKPLSKCEAVSSTNFTSEKSFENSKQDSKLSKRIPDQKPFNVLIDQLSSNELNGEKNLKVCGKTCKGNYFNKGKNFVLNNANKSSNGLTNKKCLKHCHVLLKRLNLKESNLSENRACSANEKKKRDLDTLKRANVLKNYSNLKDIIKRSKKGPTLNRDSMSFPSGSRKMNILGNAFKFQPLSVANAKNCVFPFYS
ncbi:hypothetical protein TNCV_1244591 [Trichonephila clavipes]|nr:hypothetical protein TNCV_1244591 [Trichonephila clavipes]